METNRQPAPGVFASPETAGEMYVRLCTHQLPAAVRGSPEELQPTYSTTNPDLKATPIPSWAFCDGIIETCPWDALENT